MSGSTRNKNTRRKSVPRPEKPRNPRVAKKPKTIPPNQDDDELSKTNESPNTRNEESYSEEEDDDVSVETSAQPLVMVTVKTKKPRDYIFEQIKALVQCKLWRVCKFITSDEDRAKVTEKICSLCDFEGDSNPAQEAKWCKIHEKRSNRAVNDIRAYSQCEIKKKLFTYWTYNEKTLPSLDDFKACLNRTINYEDEAQKKIWKFWVDQILDAACANKFDWAPAVRYFNKISTASDGEGESQFNMLMNPSTEAWAMVCIENYYDSWQKQFEWKVKNPQTNIPTSKKNRILKAGEEHFPDNKWTDSHGGQQIYCGWSVEGLVQYNTYKADNITARKTDNCIELETKVLADLKADNGIVGDKPKSKKKQSKAALKAAVQTLDF